MFSKLTSALQVAVVTAMAALLLWGCSNTPTATIKGKLDNANNKKIYFEQLELGRNILLDSVQLKGNGKFSFKPKFKKEEPLFFSLRTDSVTLGTLLVTADEKVEYTGDLKSPGQYEVEGSEGSTLMKELNSKHIGMKTSYDSLTVIKNKLQEGTPEYADIKRQTAKLMVSYKQWLVRFIRQNPRSYACLMAIYEGIPGELYIFGRPDDLLYYRMVVDSLQPLYPKSEYVNVLQRDYNELEKAVKLNALLENELTETGSPDIEVNDVNGKPIKLSSLRGKVVLLDFWASWDTESMFNNNELLDIYKKYHSRGFEVYQVSLDSKKEEWVAAIERQKLPWINVSELNYTSSTAARIYNLERFPTNFLIDRNGDIVAKAIYGSTLEKKLDQLLK